MKKILCAALALCLLAALAVPALAHGAHGRAALPSRANYYAVCPLESCALTGVHSHSGAFYSAHHINDGHEYHDYCALASCTQTGYHSHDGTYCFAHIANDGHNYHSNAKHGGRHH